MAKFIRYIAFSHVLYRSPLKKLKGKGSTSIRRPTRLLTAHTMREHTRSGLLFQQPTPQCVLPRGAVGSGQLHYLRQTRVNAETRPARGPGSIVNVTPVAALRAGSTKRAARHKFISGARNTTRRRHYLRYERGLCIRSGV